MKKAFLGLVAIFVVNAIGLYFGWYLDFWWFDMVLHFLGGLFMAMFLAAYLNEYAKGPDKLKNILVIVGTTALIGVVWEFSEYIASIKLTEPFYRWFGIRAYFMGDLDDTVNDLAMDILGAGVTSILHLLRSRKPH